MRWAPAAFVLMVVLILSLGCGSKKEEEVTITEEDVYKLGSCPVSEIKVVPARLDEDEVTIGSGFEKSFTATAYDQTGRPVNALLTWSFRYPDDDSNQSAGAGHLLEVKDDRTAVFRAGGLSPGLFTIVVQDRSCNLSTEEEPQYVEGQAWIKVHSPPAAKTVCGRMRVTYGDRLDRMGDQVIASVKVLLIAEVSGHGKLGRGYKVQFYINDKRYPGKRPLYRDNETTPEPGMEVGHIALLPIYLVPGEHRVRYELLEKGEPVCGSRTERFDAR